MKANLQSTSLARTVPVCYIKGCLSLLRGRFLKAQGMNKPKYESKWILKAAAQFPELPHCQCPFCYLALSKRKLPSDPHQDQGPLTPANVAAPGLGVSWEQPSVLARRGRGQLLRI